MVIQRLSPEVQSALRSGLTITDTLQCVIELVQNSLDAGSTSIAVRVDLERLTIQVVDNGCGLTEDELNLIGTRYMTSKCHSLRDFQTNLNFYGFRGESLASLQESCGMLMINSKSKDSENTFCKVFRAKKDTQPATIAVQNRFCQGTTVIVKDFLVSLPVRKSRVEPAIELEDIRHALIYLSIINYKVSFMLRNDVTKMFLLQTIEYSDEGDALKHHCKTTKDHTLISTTVNKPPFKLMSKISRQTETNHRFHMIFVNKRLVKNKMLYKIINKELEKSFFLNNVGNKDKNLLTEKCFPVYVINIMCPHYEYDISSDPKKLQVEFRNWDIVTECLKETVTQFLSTESQLNGVPPALNECADKKVEECDVQQQKECNNLNYEAKTNVVYTTLVKRNIIQQHHLKTKIDKRRCQPIGKEKLNKAVKERESSPTKENGKQSNCHDGSLSSVETVQPVVTDKLLHSTQITASGAQSLINRKKLKTTVFKEYPLHSDSDHSFTFKIPNNRPLKRKFSEHILTESESDLTPVQQKVSHSFTFKIPNNRPLKRKFSEHILTESESDLTPVQQKVSGQLKSLGDHVDKIGGSTKTSILPIISEEFLKENLNRLTLFRNAASYFPTYEFDMTPNQAIQIDFHRSVKRHPKSNDLKVTHKQNVKFLDFEKGHFLNCERSQSSIQLFDNLSTTANQTNILDNLQTLNKSISTAFSKKEKQDKSCQTKNKNHLFFKETNNKHRPTFKEREARNICVQPPPKRFKSLQAKKTMNNSQQNLNPQNNEELLKHENVYKINTKCHFQPYDKIKRNFTNPSRRRMVNRKEKLASFDFNNLFIERENDFNNIPLYSTFKPSIIHPSSKTLVGQLEQNKSPQVFSSNSDDRSDICFSENVYNSLWKEPGNHRPNDTIQKLYTEKNNSEICLITPICHKFRELSITVKSINCKHFPNYATNTERNETLHVNEEEYNLALSKSSHIFQRGSSEQFCSVSKDNFVTLSYNNHKLNHQTKYTMSPIHHLSSTWTQSSPYKFENNHNGSSPNRQMCTDDFSIAPITLKSICPVEYNQSVTKMFGSPNATSFHKISGENQAKAYNNKQHTDSANECVKTNNLTLSCAKNKNQENLLDENMCWNEENTPRGRTVFINTISGMSSFNNPGIANKVTEPFELVNRHWFMPKGVSPLLAMTESVGENIAELTSSEREIMETIIQSKYSEDLATVKWKSSQYKDSILEHITQNEVNNICFKSKPQQQCVFSGESLKFAKVLGQVDGKFIGTCLKPNGADNYFLVFFDQHAVDERIQVETLISGYKHCDGNLISRSINPQLEVPLSQTETNILDSILPKLSKLGLKIDVGERKITVSEVPLCLWNRAAKEKHDNGLLLKMVTILIKQILLCVEDLRGLMPSLLPFVQDLINTEACRGAIKFGDTLSLEKCKMLISKLALCETQFQCAHGRPVLAPLMEIVPPEVQESKINLFNLAKKRNKKA